MAVGGVGGLIGQLFNPGLDDRLATHLTPNPNPLFQQGQGAQPGTVDSLGNASPPAPSPGSNMAPAASTQPDPVNNSYIADLLAASRRDANAQTFNEGLDQMAASFGTAQQQASKQAALRQGGGVGSSLADLKTIQGMQDQTIQDNEHARYMGNAAILAKSLGLSVDQTTELMNGPPDLIQKAWSTVQANQTKTESVKNWEQARAAMRAAGKSDAEINAALPPELLAFGSGTNLSETQYLQEKALATSQGKGADFPDFPTWTAQHAQTAKETEDAHKVALALPGLKSQLTTMDQRATDLANTDPGIWKSIMSSTSKQSAASQIFNWDGKGQDPSVLYGNGKALSTEETTAVQNARQLHLANYAANFKDAGSGQRLSQGEAQRLGSAADQLGNFSGSPEDYQGRINDVQNRIGHAMGNAHGEARDLDSLPIQYRSKIDPSFIEGPNALKNLPTWAKPTAVNSKADIDALPYGQAYKPGPGFGKYTGKILFKGQEAGYEDY